MAGLTVLVDHHRRVPVLNPQVFQHFAQSPWRLIVPQPKLRLLPALFARTPQEIEIFFSCPRAEATGICLSGQEFEWFLCELTWFLITVLRNGTAKL